MPQIAAPVLYGIPGRTGAAGFRPPQAGGSQPVQQAVQPGFIPGLAVPGLAWIAGPGGT